MRPWGDAGGNPLQNAFEVFYARNPLVKLRGALGGSCMVTTVYYMTELCAATWG
jgi:hypothetical protein